MDSDVSPVLIERNLFITLSDGVELAADLYRPADDGRYPALVVYMPYHKDDIASALYDGANRYFAKHGYACLLVDMRGTGASGGTAPPCFDSSEGDDGAQVVEWAASQQWCDGTIGMWGISYPAINAIKVAAQRPKSLKAVLAIMGTGDPSSDWFHPGGARNCFGTHAAWGTAQVALQMMPPTNRQPTQRWQRIWRERLETFTPWIYEWQGHRSHEEFWRSRSVNYEDIVLPTYFVNGWSDIFPDAMVRGFQRVSGPKRLLAGPWLHMLPDVATAHAIDYLPDALRWWDHWLKGIDDGVMKEPPVRYFVQGRGVWTQADHWPPADSSTQSLHLQPDGSLKEQPASGPYKVELVADATVGTEGGLMDPMGLGVGLPGEQSADDARSAAFTSACVPSEIQIVGQPVVRFWATRPEGRDAPVDFVAKLCHVDGSGRSHLISRGVVRQSSGITEPTDVHIPMAHTAYAIPIGHRIRLSIALGDFPNLWPAPNNRTVEILIGPDTPSTLRFLSAATPTTGSDRPPSVDPSERKPRQAIDARPGWSTTRDHVDETATVEISLDSALHTADGQSKVTIAHRARMSISSARPESATVEASRSITIDTPEAETIVVRAATHITQSGLVVDGRITVGEQTMFERKWKHETE